MLSLPMGVQDEIVNRHLARAGNRGTISVFLSYLSRGIF